MPAHTPNKIILSIQYLWMILLNYFTIRICSSRGPVVENDVEWWKIDPKLHKVIFLWFSERCHGNMCNLNVIVVLEFISRDLYLLFAIRFSSKFQNSVFYQHMRPKSGLKVPRPLTILKTDISKTSSERYQFLFIFVCRTSKYTHMPKITRGPTVL